MNFNIFNAQLLRLLYWNCYLFNFFLGILQKFYILFTEMKKILLTFKNFTRQSKKIIDSAGQQLLNRVAKFT